MASESRARTWRLLPPWMWVTMPAMVDFPESPLPTTAIRSRLRRHLEEPDMLGTNRNTLAFSGCDLQRAVDVHP